MVRLHLTEGQRNDHKAAEAMMPGLPAGMVLIADRAYGPSWFRRHSPTAE